ncbi:GTPaseactivator protein [Pelomyxa schiedti]|nr:GTPaseactivator protein [Pelomyxa schiedti]
MSHITCNRCWRVFDAGNAAFVTTCSHILCEECGRQVWNKDAASSYMLLCGLSPNQVLVVASKALDFWSYQVEASKTRDIDQLTSQMESKEKTYNEKLQDTLNKLSAAKRNLDHSLRELESTKQELSSIQSRFLECSRQKQKLEELYENLKGSYTVKDVVPSEIQRPNLEPIDRFSTVNAPPAHSKTPNPMRFAAPPQLTVPRLVCDFPRGRAASRCTGTEQRLALPPPPCPGTPSSASSTSSSLSLNTPSSRGRQTPPNRLTLPRTLSPLNHRFNVRVRISTKSAAAFRLPLRPPRNAPANSLMSSRYGRLAPAASAASLTPPTPSSSSATRRSSLADVEGAGGLTSGSSSSNNNSNSNRTTTGAAADACGGGGGSGGRHSHAHGHRPSHAHGPHHSKHRSRASDSPPPTGSPNADAAAATAPSFSVNVSAINAGKASANANASASANASAIANAYASAIANASASASGGNDRNDKMPADGTRITSRKSVSGGGLVSSPVPTDSSVLVQLDNCGVASSGPSQMSSLQVLMLQQQQQQQGHVPTSPLINSIPYIPPSLSPALSANPPLVPLIPPPPAHPQLIASKSRENLHAYVAPASSPSPTQPLATSVHSYSLPGVMSTSPLTQSPLLYSSPVIPSPSLSSKQQSLSPQKTPFSYPIPVVPTLQLHSAPSSTKTTPSSSPTVPITMFIPPPLTTITTSPSHTSVANTPSTVSHSPVTLSLPLRQLTSSRGSHSPPRQTPRPSSQSPSPSPKPTPRNARNPNLSELLLAPKLEVVSALCHCVIAKEKMVDYSITGTLLLKFFSSFHQLQRLLQHAIRMQVSLTYDSGTLFRGLNAASRVLSAFYHLEAHKYLVSLLQPTVATIYERFKNLEPDPVKSGSPEMAAQNCKELQELMQQLVVHLLNSIDECPLNLRKVLKYADMEIKTKWPDISMTVTVGGFFFLRFIAPALVAPHTYGLASSAPSSEVQRILFIVTKAFQCMASGSGIGTLGSVDTYSRALWLYIQSKLGDVNAFFRSLIDVSIEEDGYLEYLDKPIEPTDVTECLLGLHSRIKASMSEIRDWILQHYPISGPSIVDQLKKINGESVFIITQQAIYTPDVSEYCVDDAKKAICGSIDSYSRTLDRKLARAQKQYCLLQDQRTARETEITQNQNDVTSLCNTHRDMQCQIEAINTQNSVLNSNIVLKRQQIEQEIKQRKIYVKYLKKIQKAYLKVKPPSKEVNPGIWTELATLLSPIFSGKEPDFFLLKVPKAIPPHEKSPGNTTFSASPSPIENASSTQVPTVGSTVTNPANTGASTGCVGNGVNENPSTERDHRNHAASIAVSPNFSMFDNPVPSSVPSSSALRSPSPDYFSSRHSSPSPDPHYQSPTTTTTTTTTVYSSPPNTTNSSSPGSLDPSKSTTPSIPSATTHKTTTPITKADSNNTNHNKPSALSFAIRPPKGIAESSPLVYTHTPSPVITPPPKNLTGSNASLGTANSEDIKSKQPQTRRWFRTKRS